MHWRTPHSPWNMEEENWELILGLMKSFCLVFVSILEWGKFYDMCFDIDSVRDDLHRNSKSNSSFGKKFDIIDFCSTKYFKVFRVWHRRFCHLHLYIVLSFDMHTEDWLKVWLNNLFIVIKIWNMCNAFGTASSLIVRKVFSIGSVI